MTHVRKQYSQLWLNIPQVLKTLLFRSVHKALESFCSQEYNLTQHNSSLLCLKCTDKPVSSRNSGLVIPSAFPGIISCSKGPGNQRGRRTAKHWSPGARSEAPPRESILPGTGPAQPISFHGDIKSVFLHWMWNINHKQAWTQLLKKIKQKKRKFCNDNAEHLIPLSK